MKIDSNITECPYCGYDEYYIKQYIKGKLSYYKRFDGKEADNSDMYDYLDAKNISKYAWCGWCHKRLFKLDNLED